MGIATFIANMFILAIAVRVPCVGSGQWKKPYEILQKDLYDIKEELINYKHSKTIDQKKEDLL